MHRIVLLAACIGLGAVVVEIEDSRGRAATFAKDPGAGSGLRAPSLEGTYAGWSRKKLVAALERCKSEALGRKEALLDQRTAESRRDVELERLADEIEWLAARISASSVE
jgi:hypothetical protein